MSLKQFFTQKVASIFCTLLLGFSITSFAETTPQNCSDSFLSKHPHEVLGCYINTNNTQSWHLVKTEEKANLEIFHYELTSQFWPPNNISNSGQYWHHQLDLIVPSEVKNSQSFLYITGGSNYDDNGNPIDNSQRPLSYETQMMSNIATQFGSVVAVLHEVPNQYISFDDGVPRKEDGVIAYTWNRFMDDPIHGKYWPAHIAMAKAAVSAMNLVQAESKNQKYVKPTHFVVSGASKRGWTTWLTALADNRVNAIVPMVIDIFNSQQNLQHIYKAYNAWPDAFNDYVQQGVADRLSSPEATQLFNIEDPASYMAMSKFRKRLSIPKLIINASSDEFFPPDSLQQYIRFIPGHNLYRTEPNQTHSIQNSPDLSSLVSHFYQMLLDQAKLPNLSWQPNYVNHTKVITTDFIPDGTVNLWHAYNPKKRDFRFETTDVKYKKSDFQGGKCNQQTHTCTFILKDVGLEKGFIARFLEFNYHDSHGHSLSLTSPVFIDQQ
ncbi:hypothetical protein SOPP22_10540 [Shewanella sp. OPT22]|nr:hypothetical protein SOPP22_10540 [Shewanella sp. OPT22]